MSLQRPSDTGHRDRGLDDPVRRPAARLAATAPNEPTRPGSRGGRLVAARQLRRNRTFDAQPRDGAAPGRRARRARARTEPSADRGGPGARLRRTLTGRPRHGGACGTASSGCWHAYEPFPCLAVDRGWRVLRFNAGATVLLDGVAPHLLEEPNALRIALHPDGLAPRIRNLAEWRHHVVGRLRARDRRGWPGAALVAAGRNRLVSGRFRDRPRIWAESRCRWSCTPPTAGCSRS